MPFDSILETIGRTPHVRIQRLYDPAITVWSKLERANPGGSIKDRIALSMVEDAEARGILGPESVIIEPTSGNTGIGLAMVAAVKGYRLILVMPESFSIERRKLMAAYGAEFDLTPRELGMKGAIARAAEIAAETPGAWVASQFANPANPAVHRRTTAQEILDDFPDGLDFLVTGVGTGGHITGCAEVLKEQLASAQGVRRGADALAGALRRHAQPAPHPGHRRRLHPGGHAAGAAGRHRRRSRRRMPWPTRGAPPGRKASSSASSSGASLAAVAQLRPQIPDGSRVLTFDYDSGERYLSVDALWGTA